MVWPEVVVEEPLDQEEVEEVVVDYQVVEPEVQQHNRKREDTHQEQGH